MASRCVFCDDKPTTKEHVYPKWLRKVVTGDRFITVLETNAGRKERCPKVGFDLTENAVCQTCNSGWMSELENEVLRLLTPMIGGESRKLDAREQCTVATWVHKTMLMMYQKAPMSDVTVPKDHYLDMYRRKKPSAGTRSPSHLRAVMRSWREPGSRIRDHACAAGSAGRSPMRVLSTV